jgi:hypothetical protein
MAGRQRRESEKYCCTMVAVTFMTLFVCSLLLGVVILSMYRKKGGHD